MTVNQNQLASFTAAADKSKDALRIAELEAINAELLDLLRTIRSCGSYVDTTIRMEIEAALAKAEGKS
jgi:hypothetical protein